MGKDDILKNTQFYKVIFKYIIPYKKRFISLFLVTLFQTILTVVISLYWGVIIDEIVYHQDKEVFLWLIFFIIGLILIYAFFEFVSTAAFWNTQLRFVLDLRMAVMRKVYDAKAEFFNKKNFGDIVYCVNLDTPEFMNVITDNIFELFSTILACLVVFVILLFVNPIINIFILFATVIMSLVSIKLGKISRELTYRMRDENGKLNSLIFSIIRGLNDIRTNQGEKGAFFYFSKSNEEVYNLNKKIRLNQFVIEKMNGLISNLVVVCLFIFGGYLSSISQITVGIFVTSMTLITYITSRLVALYNFYIILQGRKSSLERVFNILQMHTEENEIREHELRVCNGKIEISNLYFEFEQEHLFSIKNINCIIEKGEKIGIVGKNGSGKTTLFNLITNIYIPFEGKIFIDGQNLSECTYKSIRESIATVQQEVIIFDDTIRNNLKLNKFYSDSEIWKACDMACIDHWIQTLPNGLDTVIGKNGYDLSMGQKQRIAIARALLKKPKILLLDEASSALDRNAEKEVENEIINNSGNTTLLVISHNFNTIKKMDRIMVFDNGRMIAFDTHNNLIMHCQYYKKLFRELDEK